VTLAKRLPPQRLHLTRQPGIGNPVDGAQSAAHLLAGLAGRRMTFWVAIVSHSHGTS
jgi:hypothetical protein